MADHKLKCRQCQGEDFNLQDGLYFCNECGIQIENLVEMEHDEHNENLQSQHRIKLTTDKKKQKDNLKARRLTSWEEYNYILIGLVDEILSIQAIPGFKSTCLQLWISYLRSTEAAFFSKESAVAPKLFATYRQADAEILYNKKSKEKKPASKKSKAEAGVGEEEGERQRQKRMRKSEKIISQELNESAKSESFNTSLLANLSLESIKSDQENAEIEIEWSAAGARTRKKKSTQGNNKVQMVQLSRLETSQVLTGSTLLHIIYCALNICGSDLQLSDLIRFVREGHVSFFKMRVFLPDDIIEQGVPLSFQEHHSYRMINYEYTRKLLSYFVRLIPDLSASFRTPNLIALARRYTNELNLPSDLGDYIERLMIFLPPVMNFRLYAPNYEGRALAYVLFVLKLLFGVDGYREKEMSESARRVNRKAKPQQEIFVYEDWRKFIEYRQIILGKFYYPTLLFHHENFPDQPYMAFNAMLESLNPKTHRTESQIVNVYNEKRMQAKTNASEIMIGLAKAHANSTFTQFSFHSSLTPLADNYQHILRNESIVNINRKIAEVNYTTHSLKAFLAPQTLVDELAEKGIELQTKKSTFLQCFAFLKPASYKKPNEKEVFELQLDKSVEDLWSEDLKERAELIEEVESSAAEEFHRKQLAKVLAKRKMWRENIYNDKFKANESDSDDDEGPKNFHETSIFSESEDQSEVELDVDDIDRIEDPELERLFQKHEQPKLKLIVPDFNLWQRSFSMIELDPRGQEPELDKLPKSFIWLLKLGASILHQHPLSLYHQLLCIEHQFTVVYQPVEMLKSVLLKQKTGRKFVKPMHSRQLEAMW